MNSLLFDSTSFIKKIGDTFYQPVDLSAAAQSLASTASSVLSFVTLGRLKSFKKQAESVETAALAVKDLTKQAFSLKDTVMGYWHMIKPYQPIISACTIMGKASWKNLNCQKKKREIDRLTNSIQVCRGVLQTKKKELSDKELQIKKVNPEEIQKLIDNTQIEIDFLERSSPSKKQNSSHKKGLSSLRGTLETLKKEQKLILEVVQLRADMLFLENHLKEKLLDRAAKRVDLSSTVLSVLQLPSLLFPHPGSNAWNSFVSLCGRFYPIQLAMRKESLFEVALGTIASIGTLSSFLEQTEVVQEDNPVTDCAILAAMVVHAVEFVIMVKDQIPTARKQLSNFSCFCFCSKKK